MSAMASQISIVWSTIGSGANQRNQSSASLALVRGIHRWPVNSPHKGPVTRKMFLFDDVIMILLQNVVPSRGSSRLVIIHTVCIIILDIIIALLGGFIVDLVWWAILLLTLSGSSVLVCFVLLLLYEQHTTTQSFQVNCLSVSLNIFYGIKYISMAWNTSHRLKIILVRPRNWDGRHS